MTAHTPYLKRLEDESLHIIREVAAECRAPVFLYSIGKDSSVLLRLMQKAFHPGPLPFPVMHIDTKWKFREMIEHRDATAKRLGFQLIVYSNDEALAKGVNPFDHGAYFTHATKTEPLKAALTKFGFDAAFGGARRDEEKSRAKERIFSVRNASHGWDPKNQRPEFWHLYNARVSRGESLRVFPLSNWTESDIWQYIMQEEIPIVPLYYAKERPTVMRDNTIIVVDDERMRLHDGEVPVMRKVRFRSLGCYPLTGAIESDASTLPDIVAETLGARTSERGGRLIDKDENDSMERKKREGYF